MRLTFSLLSILFAGFSAGMCFRGGGQANMMLSGICVLSALNVIFSIHGGLSK